MNCIFSIKKQYSDLIFNKIKPIEFRNIYPKSLENNDKVYIYESKKNGCGKVVGYFIVDSIKEIKHSKIGTYLYMDMYANLFCDEYTKNMVKKAKQITLENFYNDYVLSFLYMDDYLDEMLKTHIPYKIDFLSMTNNDWKKYDEIKQKQTDFLEDCDNWLRKIGFYNDCDCSNWKYEIKIKDVKKFDTPIPIEQFRLMNGNYLKKAPQSFCYTLNNN